MARQSKTIAEHRICSQSFLESKPIEAMVLSGEDALTILFGEVRQRPSYPLAAIVNPPTTLRQRG
jgi:hypothetical protein